MLRITLNNPKSGWVRAQLSDGSKDLVVTASYTPVDVLRDFLDSVQSLQDAEKSECCWYQEPGELHWCLRRRGKDLEVEILSFPNIPSLGQQGGNAVSVFKAQTDWLSFAKQVFNSVESMKATLGLEGYERAWRHPFPKEAHEKLRNALLRQC